MTLLQTGYDGLVIGVLYALVGLGIVVIFRSSNVLNFGQGALATLAGYLSWQATATWGLPYPIAFILAVAAGTVVGTLLGAILTFLMPNASVTEKSVAALGFAFVLGWGCRVWFGELTQVGPIVFERTFKLGGVAITGTSLYVLVMGALALAIVFWLLHGTRLGLAMRALSQDQETARSYGVSVVRISMLSWMIGSALGSASGVLVGSFIQLDHAIMITIMVQAFAALVLGGFGSAIGAVVGGIALGISSSAITTYVNSNFKNTILLLIVLVILVVRPAGLMGAKRILMSEGGGEGRSLPALPRPGSYRRAGRLSGTVLAGLLLVALPFIPHPFSMVTYAVMIATAISVLSLSVFYGYVGELSLGHGAFVTAGAYTTALFMQNFTGASFLVSVLAAIFVAGCFGGIVGWATLRLSGYYLTVATLFLTFMVTETVLQFKSQTGGSTGISVGIPSLMLLDLETDRDFYYLAVAALALTLAVLVVLLHSRLGRIWVAIRDAPSAALASGIAVNQHKVLALIVSSAIAGVGGSVLVVVLSHVGPYDFGMFWSIMLILAAVAGGAGSLAGAVFGAALITLVPEALSGTRGLSEMVLGLALMVVLVVMPGGLPAVVERIRAMLFRRRRAPHGRGAPNAQQTHLDMAGMANDA